MVIRLGGNPRQKSIPPAGLLLYTFGHNTKQTDILGLAGAGGIDFCIIIHTKLIQHGRATFLMLVLLIDVIIGWTNVKLRDRYVIKVSEGRGHRRTLVCTTW